MIHRILWTLILLTIVAGDASAVSVAPHALFMDHRERSTVFYVHNPSDQPTKVTIDLQFGFITADSTGTAKVALVPAPDSNAPNAAAWIRAFPPKLVLEPGQRQAVRLMAEPPLDLADGEYWSRVIVAAEEIRSNVPEATDQVRVGLNMIMRTITSLNYRKGVVSTGVRLRNASAQVDDAKLVTRLELDRAGNAAFLGTVDVSIADAAGEPVGSWRRPIAVYDDTQRRMAWDVPELPRGRYRVTMRVSTERQDIPASDLLPAEVVQRVVPLTVD